MASLAPEFDKRGVKLAALSCDSAASHKEWIKDIVANQKLSGADLPYPIIADEKRAIAKRFGMVDPDVRCLLETSRLRHLARPGRQN